MSEVFEQLDGKSPEELEQMLEAELKGQETPDTPEKKPAESAAEQPPPPTLEDLQAQLSRLQKQVQDKETFINQRNQEIGLLRKQLRDAAPAPDLDITDEEMISNPKEALKKALRQHEQQKQQSEDNQRQEVEQFRSQAREAIAQWEPEYEQRVPDLMELMKADKAPESLIQQFKDDPFATLNPAVTFQLLERAKMAKRIKELEASLEAANKRPSDMVTKIQQAGRAKPVATTTTPSPKTHSALENLTVDDIDRMSKEDIDKLVSQLERSR